MHVKKVIIFVKLTFFLQAILPVYIKYVSLVNWEIGGLATTHILLGYKDAFELQEKQKPPVTLTTTENSVGLCNQAKVGVIASVLVRMVT